MEYRILGKTGLRVSRMGFGGIPIQRIDREGTRVLIHGLLEAGVNFIDTAHGYTVSEEYLGYALQGVRDRFVLASKSPALTREGLLADLDLALKRLGTDHLDLYQFHNPSAAGLEQILAPGGAMEGMLEAKADGRVRHIGVTSHSLALFRRYVDMDWVETVMFPYNIVENQAAELIAGCAEKNIGFICMKPLAGGAIEDGRLALRYIAANPAVTEIIPGMAAPEELAQNLAAMNDASPLTAGELADIARVRESLGNQFCRRCNYCAPCTAGISIPSVFLFEGYLSRYGLADWARSRYDTLAHTASECVSCGACEPRCPYHLPIREMMAKAATKFGK